MKYGVKLRLRRLFLFAVLVAAAVLGYAYVNEADSAKTYVSRAAVSRMTALLKYTQTVCETSEVNLPEDVEADAWYAPYVKVALDEGYFTTENNKFYPMKLVTKAEAAYIASKLKVDSSKLGIDIYTEDTQALIEASDWMKIYEAAAGNTGGLEIKDVTVVSTSAKSSELKAWYCSTDAGELYFPGFALDRLDGRTVRVAVRENVAAAVLSEKETAAGKTSGASGTAEAFNEQNHSESDGVKAVFEPMIRVILNRDDFSGVVHGGVSLVSDSPVTMRCGALAETVEAGKQLDFYPADNYFKDGGEVTLETDGGKITVTSLNRNHGHPSYRGKIHLSAGEGGLYIVNELPLEQYLYGVVPSEMPVTGGKEALKVQAVCARSFAYKSMSEKTAYAGYGADVDDSTSCQVYNNAPEDETACAAVDETAGELLYGDGAPVKAYFFSTSCGVTSNAGDVWLSSPDISYLSAGLQDAVVSGDGTQAVSVPNNAAPDLSDEAAFRLFIDDTQNRDYYEKDSPLFRWYVHLEPEDIKTEIENPAAVNVNERGSSGVVKKLTVSDASGNMVTLAGEYSIRKALSVAGKTIECGDGTKVTNQTMLPSGYFYVDANEGGFDIYGGGFGHGVGMSQNGVISMTKRGMDYKAVLAHYFKGTTLQKAR